MRILSSPAQARQEVPGIICAVGQRTRLMGRVAAISAAAQHLRQIRLSRLHSAELRPSDSVSTFRSFASSTSASRPSRTSLSASVNGMAPLSCLGMSSLSASVGSSSRTPPP